MTKKAIKKAMEAKAFNESRDKELIDIALESPKVQKALEGKTIKEIVYIDRGKTKVINFVTEE